MRVLQVLGSLGRAGAETMIVNYYRELVKKNCQFDFIVHSHVSNGYEKDIEKLGGKVIRLHRPGEIGLFRYIKEVRNAIREYGPYDAIHIHTNTQGFMPAFAAYREKIPVILVHSHSTNFSKVKVMINKIVGDFAKVKRLACGEEAGKALYGKRKFEVINNAIPIEHFYIDNDEIISQTKDNLGINNKFIIGHIGRFVEEKNHPFIIEVLASLLKRNKQLVLCFAGDGPLRFAVENKVKQLDIANQVVFLGVRNDMNIVYNMFDVLILPSTKEGLPLTVIEAQAAGKKCLCSDNITTECDMNLGLVEFASLNEKEWIKRLDKCIIERQTYKPTFSEVKYKMHKYDIKSQADKLLLIYKGKI